MVDGRDAGPLRHVFELRVVAAGATVRRGRLRSGSLPFRGPRVLCRGAAPNNGGEFHEAEEKG